jgi:hypothetical protein
MGGVPSLRGAARLTAALGAALAVAAPAAQAAHSELALRMPLDEQSGGYTPDVSGHGLKGETNGVEFSASPARFGRSYIFDGISSHIDVTSDPVLQPSHLTVMAWVKGRLDPPTNYEYVVAKGADSCAASSWALYTGPDAANAGIGFYVYSGGHVYLSPVAGKGIWTDEKWHAVAGTYDGTRVRLYLDGNEVGAGTPVPAGTAIDYSPENSDLELGRYPNSDSCGGAHAWEGNLDEVRVYNRALTLDEVRLLQDPNATEPPQLPPPGGGGGGGGGAGGQQPEPPPPPQPPIPQVAFAKSKAVRSATWLSAAGTQTPSGAAITKYEWDFNLDGKFEADCGGPALSAVSRVFRKPGTKTVALRVTDALGQTAIGRQSFSVARDQINLARYQDTVHTCENPGPNFQPDSADCIKTFAWGIVEVNSQGGPDDCFKLESRAAGTEVSIPGIRSSQVAERTRSFYYRASIRDDVAVNGLVLPLPSSQETVYDSGESAISAGTRDITIGPYRVGEVPLVQKIPFKLAKKGPRSKFALGSFDLEKVLSKVFGLKAGASVKLAFLERKTEALVGLKLPSIFSFQPFKNDPAQAQVALIASNREGVKYDGARLSIPYVFIGPLLLDNLFFEYRLADNSWKGGAGLRLAPLALPALEAVPPPPDNGFAMKDGQFASGGVRLDFPIGTRPVIFPGVSLSSIGAAIGVKPTRFNGNASVAVGEVVDVSGQLFAVFATPERPYYFPEEGLGAGLGPLAGRELTSTTFAVGGSVGLKVKQLGFDVPLSEAYAIYQYPDFAEFGGTMGFDHEYFTLRGQVGGFVQVLAKKFNLEGSFEACLRKPIRVCAPKVGGVVSSKGIGFCTIVPVPNPLAPLGPPTIPVPAGIGYHWGQGVPQVMIFSCGYDGYREANPRKAQAGEQGFTLPDGLPSAMIRVTGNGGAPSVVLTGPNGERIEASGAGEGTFNSEWAVLGEPKENRTLIALRKPAGGRWTVAAADGSVPVTRVATARGLEEPKVRAKVSGRGFRSTLTYSVENLGSRRVTFQERGARTFRVLGTTTRSKGSIRFRPGEGRTGRRDVVAVIEDGGVEQQTVVVTSYRAPASGRPGKPRRLRAVHRGSAARVSWAGVRGATRYAVTLALADGRKLFRVTRRRRVDFAGVAAGDRGKVTVVAHAANGRQGAAAVATLPRLRRR